MLVGPCKCLKQIIQIELNRVKNPNWPEASQLAIYKRDRGFELGTTVNKSSWWSERDLNSGPPNCKSSALNTRPRCLLKKRITYLASVGISRPVNIRNSTNGSSQNLTHWKLKHTIGYLLCIIRKNLLFVKLMASIFVFYVSLNIIFLRTD